MSKFLYWLLGIYPQTVQWYASPLYRSLGKVSEDWIRQQRRLR